MIYSEVAAAEHRDLSIQLKACCKKCPMPNGQRVCRKAKTHCCFYNRTIAKYVLARYPVFALLEIPVDSFVRGLRAHDYSGELRQVIKVKI